MLRKPTPLSEQQEVQDNFIHVNKFNNNRDLQTLKSWLEARELPIDYAKDLPSIGFSVFSEDKLIAAGFIRTCEGNYALLDAYITDPAASKQDRNEALDLLTSHISKAAKQMNFKVLMAFCKDENTIVRAQQHGFEALPHVFLSLNLAKVK